MTRSYAVAATTFGLLAVVTFVLGVAGVTSFTWFVGCIIGAIVSILVLRRDVG